MRNSTRTTVTTMPTQATIIGTSSVPGLAENLRQP